MNSKSAKYLRRLLNKLADAHKISVETTYLQNPRTNQIIVDPKCVRGVYKRMKRLRKNKYLNEMVNRQSTSDKLSPGVAL